MKSPYKPDKFPMNAAFIYFWNLSKNESKLASIQKTSWKGMKIAENLEKIDRNL